MNTTRKVWIAVGLIAALSLSGLVAATDQSPLVTMGNGCCRASISPTEEPTPLPIAQPDLPPIKRPMEPEPASSAP